jgi:hypothetical protein
MLYKKNEVTFKDFLQQETAYTIQKLRAEWGSKKKVL